MTLAEHSYRAAMLFGSIAAGPAFYLHSRGRRRLVERYGIWDIDSPSEVLWFHGASVGEIGGLLPILKSWRSLGMEEKVLLTATSPTGLGKENPELSYQRLLPFDHPFWIRRALKNIKPRAFIFGETEIWPETIRILDEQKVPLYMVNARITDYSISGYSRIGGFVERSLRRLSGIYAATELDAERFIKFGADPSIVKVFGNAKFDRPPSIGTSDEAFQLKKEVFANDLPVLVLGSIHPGEEPFWFDEISRRAGEFNTVVAPRHSERFGFFAEEFEKRKILFSKRSELGNEKVAGNVLLLDSLGELDKFYSIADVAFVGATLVDIGGHNPLEPAAYGAAVVLGPNTKKIAELVVDLESADALRRIATADDVRRIVEMMINNSTEIKKIGNAAKRVFQNFLGASSRIAEALAEELKL